jgi:pantoate ligase / CMP/dCMP kinase
MGYSLGEFLSTGLAIAKGGKIVVRLFTSIAGLRCFLIAQRLHHPALEETTYAEPLVRLPLEVGFVPTMGALHQGHLSLIQRARNENKLVVVSIFVNPLQFAPTEDLQRYPRPLEQDQALCAAAGVDALFVPSPQEMGATSQGIQTTQLTQVWPPAGMTSGLCGSSRQGHFQGVATIVSKLLNIVQPTRAYFGQKDAQQLAIIRQLVTDLNLPVDIVGCPIVRENTGLACSSRNRYLSELERQQATALFRGLKQAEQAFHQGARSRDALIAAVDRTLAAVPQIAPEYVQLVHPHTLEPLDMIQESGLLAVAARVGSARLIDNLLLSTRKPIIAIDGPAGAGKSTVAKRVAQALGLFYLDTGAMYRAITWLALEANLNLHDEPAIAELVSQSQIRFGYSPQETVGSQAVSQTGATDHAAALASTVYVNETDVTQVIRTVEVTSHVSTIAAQPVVRQALVQQQQRYGRQGGIVVEGRDIGTHVFPDAELKVFLTASVQERARRRQLDLRDRGLAELSLEALEQSISERDMKDSTRLIAPLRKAADAIELQTDGYTIEQVVQQIVSLYQQV